MAVPPESEWESLPRTPVEAKQLGLKHYFTGVACKHGHVSVRQVSSEFCFECQRVAGIARRSDPSFREARRARERERRANDPEYREARNAKVRERYANDAEYRKLFNAKVREHRRERCANDLEYLEARNAKARERRANDPEYREALNAKLREYRASDPEYNKRNRDRRRERRATDPEWAEAERVRHRKRRADPKVREAENAKVRKYVRERYANDPEWRETVLAKQRERRANDPDWREAMNEKARARYAANPEKHREETQARRAADPQKWRAWNRAWREANLEKSRSAARDQYAANAEKIRERVREWGKADRAINPAKHRLRHRRLRHRYPPWLTDAERAEIVRIYADCPPDRHVDHIVPLRGKLIAGLHVPQNLQYLPGSENISKGNRIDITIEEAVEFIARGMAVWAAHTDQRPHHYKIPDWQRVAYADPNSDIDIPPQPKPSRAVAIRPASSLIAAE